MNYQDLFKGFVKVNVEGFYIERIINSCRKNNIGMINLDRKSNTIINADISVKCFKEFTSIVKDNNCRMKIIKKRGIPFIARKYKKRKVFLSALIASCLFIIILSKFVWNIEVVGDNNSQEIILNIAREEGLEIGKLKKTINLDKIINRIRLERADVSWVGIKMSGTNVRIEIVKADPKPDIVDENEYCNIVANKDCVIDCISAQNGTPRVVKGDVVKKGDILIEGIMEGKYTEPQMVHSVGEVKGKIWYKEKVRFYYKQVKKNQTGRKEVKYSLKVDKFEINFFKKLSKFEIYDTIRTDKKLKISSSFYLPITFGKNTNYEIKNDEIEYTVDEAKNKAVEEARMKLKERIGNCGDIVNEYINTDENEEYIDVELTYEVLENIGTEEKIAL